MSQVQWRLVVLDDRTAAMMTEVARLYEGAGNKAIVPVQGSYSGGVNASGGTHDGGGAIDLSVRGMSPAQIETVVTLMRRVGFADWHRWEWQGPWVEHIHGVAMGCKDASPAAKVQMQNYLDGDDGLVGAARDYHTRQYVGVTWEQYRAAHPTGSGSSIPTLPTTPTPTSPSTPTPEDDMFEDTDRAKIEQILAVLMTGKPDGNHDDWPYPFTPTERVLSVLNGLASTADKTLNVVSTGQADVALGSAKWPRPWTITAAAYSQILAGSKGGAVDANLAAPIAAAIPKDIAKQVADLLAARLTS